MADKEKERLEYEVVLNVGGGAVMSVRVEEKTAGQVAMALAMDWPSDCVIRWPLIIRKVGVRPEIEGDALAAALRKIVEIPDGELVIWVAGKRGASKLEAGDGEGLPNVLDSASAVAEVRRIIESAGGEDWGWFVRTAEAGEALSK